MRKIGVCVFITLMALLSACSKKEASAPALASAPVAASTPAEAKTGSGAPDFGGITKVTREVEAIGSTQELAVVAALQSAVAQVNGVRVASQMQAVRAGLDVSVNGQGAESVRSEAFVQKLLAASQGAVTGFEILDQQEIDKVDEEAIAHVRASDGGYSYSASASSEGQTSVDARASARGDGGSADTSYKGSASYGQSANVDVKRGPSSYQSDSTYRKMRSYWKVKVRAVVAQYRAPDEQGRPKIVVAMPKTLSARFSVGDSQIAASDVARAVRGRLSDVLTQTKRFIVLDREFGSDIQAEIDRINSGNTRVQDSARLGQQLATDLILIPTIERFEYLRSVRQLRMSDRQLVSYEGAGRVTLRLLNATTGEVVLSDSFDYKPAPTEPSTMPRVIDGQTLAADMMNALSGQMGSAIVTQIFPISVVAVNGDQAVLSQGGDSVKVGQRWQAVCLGEELKDPATGRALGRNEELCGTIRIDRVSTQTSYGTLEEGASTLDSKPFKPGQIELRKQVVVAKKSESSAPSALEKVSTPSQTSRNTRQATLPQPKSETSLKPQAASNADSNW